MKKLVAALIISALSITAAYAGQTNCPENFAGGSAPEYTNQKVAAKTRELCNFGYAVGHSGISRGPLWSAEHMTRERLQSGRGLPRANNFRPDTRLPANERAELRDYARSGYDRGHMFCAADSASPGEQSESFLLSNMVPQNQDNNRNLHEGIESAVRKEGKRAGELFVITGPIFQGSNLQALKGRVIIPSGIFKCLYYPRKNQAGCYVEQNAPGMQYNVASVSEVEKVIGISLFPGVASAVKDRAIQLPEPTPDRKSVV